MSMTTELTALVVTTEFSSVVVESTFELSVTNTSFTNLNNSFNEVVSTIIEQAASTLIVETTLSTGIRGKPGLDPYEEWLAKGNTGSYNDFLISISNLSTGALWVQADW